MLKEKIVITGVLTAESGVHIGGYKDGMGIGATDNPVIKNPLTGAPYIPGSSIKGKMRSLFESNGFAKGNQYPCKCGRSDCIVCKLFGAHQNVKGESGSPRLIFRDAYLTEKFENIDNVIEIKAETAIDRTTGTAKNGSLREFERVAGGTLFNYEIDIVTQDGDNADEMIAMVETGLRMIEATGLGGKVSAGYGQVNFGINDENYKVTKTAFKEV